MFTSGGPPGIFTFCAYGHPNGVNMPGEIALRPYQAEAVNAVEAAVEQGQRAPLVVLPTGTGKTILVSKLIERTSGRRVLLVNREELIEQSVEKIGLFIDPAAIGIVAGSRDDCDADVVVASVQTLARPDRLAGLLRHGPVALTVVDEAHHAAAGSWRQLIQAIDADVVVGLTATPERADGQKLDVFDDVVYRRGVGEMILQGYLSDVRGLSVKIDGLDLSAVTRNGRDFDDGALGAALEAADVPKLVVSAWQRFASDRKTIVYVPTVELAGQVAKQFLAVGVPGGVVSGGMASTARRQAIADFRAGRTKVLSNAMLLTEGFDEPAVDCVVVARPTRSRSLYQQIIGRGLRRHPGKTDLLVLDLHAEDRAGALDLEAFTGVRKSRLAKEGFAAAARDELRKPKDPALVATQSVIAEMAEQIVAEAIAVVEAATLAWAPVAGGAFVLTLPGLKVRLEPAAEVGRYAVVVSEAGAPTKTVADDVDLEMAQGIAEDVVRGANLDKLADKTARWRRGPATAKQVAALRRLRYPGDPATLTAGEASEQIAALTDQIEQTWNGPATPRQLWALRRLGVGVPDQLTKRDASNLIAEHSVSA